MQGRSRNQLIIPLRTEKQLFDNTKWATRSRKSKKDRQRNEHAQEGQEDNQWSTKH